MKIKSNKATVQTEHNLTIGNSAPSKKEEEKSSVASQDDLGTNKPDSPVARNEDRAEETGFSKSKVSENGSSTKLEKPAAIQKQNSERS